MMRWTHEFRLTALRVNSRGHAVIGDTLAIVQGIGRYPDEADDLWGAFSRAFAVAEGTVDFAPLPLESPDGWCCLCARMDRQHGEVVGIALWRAD